MQYRIELALYVQADSAEQVREIAEEAIKVGRDRASDLCEASTMTRGEPVPVSTPVETVPITRAFDSGASAC